MAQLTQVCRMQLTTQRGITAGLEADQATRLAHIDSLKKEMTALKVALKEQQDLTQANESSLEAAHDRLRQHELVMTGQQFTWVHVSHVPRECPCWFDFQASEAVRLNHAFRRLPFSHVCVWPWRQALCFLCFALSLSDTYTMW